MVAISLDRGSIYAESPPLLDKIRATYALLYEVHCADTNMGQPTKRPAAELPEIADDTVARRWLDDFLACKRGISVSSWQGRNPVMKQWLADEFIEVPDGPRILTRLRDDDWNTKHDSLFHDVLTPRGEKIDIVAASSDEANCLLQAVAMLQKLDQELTTSVLKHTSIICVVAGPDVFECASDRRLPRAVYLSRGACSDPVRAAEALLHESVHQKLYDMQVLYTIYAPNYDSRSAATVRPTWHPVGTAWPVDRVLAASHVYVHLTRFHESLTLAPPPGYNRKAFATAASQSRGRADMLLGALVPLADTYLNQHGAAFLSWLRDVHTPVTNAYETEESVYV